MELAVTSGYREGKKGRQTLDEKGGIVSPEEEKDNDDARCLCGRVPTVAPCQ